MTADVEPNHVDDIPTEQKGAFHSFLKSLASFSGDLSTLTCPPFLLAPVSLIEYSEYWTQQPDLFANIASSNDPAERMVSFVKWYISALNASFSSRVPPGEWEKKPFNPVLGEQYTMTWRDPDGSGETTVFCEQVSHHPPVTAFHIHNPKANITLNGHTGQKTRFSAASMTCDQAGRSLVTLHDHNETYMFTYPSLTVHGIWKAAPYVELSGNSYIQSSSGYFAVLEFVSKGWISGEKNRFKCYLRKNDNPRDDLFKMDGQWSAASTMTIGKSKTTTPFLDVCALRPATKHVEESNNPLNTRVIWKNVSDAIRAGDVQTAGVEKSKVENQQRAERKERETKGMTWAPRHFQWEEKSNELMHLENLLNPVINNKCEDTQSAGHWAFVQQ